MSKISIWPIDKTLSDASTSCQSGPGSNGNEGVLRIPQSSNITGASPSDCLMSYPGHSLGVGRSYPFAEMQSVYSTVPTNKYWIVQTKEINTLKNLSNFFEKILRLAIFSFVEKHLKFLLWLSAAPRVLLSVRVPKTVAIENAFYILEFRRRAFVRLLLVY